MGEDRDGQCVSVRGEKGGERGLGYGVRGGCVGGEKVGAGVG